MPATTRRIPPNPTSSRSPPGPRNQWKPGNGFPRVRGFRGSVRRARAADLAAIRQLEAACFQPYRQASGSSLRRSLASKRQSVWVIAGKGRLDALLVLWHHPHRLRVYDVAVHPDLQGQGLGQALMRHAERLAADAGCTWVSLEADPKEPGLVAWYERQGYAKVARLASYYKDGRAAVRMTKRVTG